MSTHREPAGTVVSYLEQTLGLSFTGPRRARLLTTIEAQRVSAGLSQEEFLAAVSRPGRVHDRVLAEVTVGETFFFRDRVQCELLRDVVLPTLATGTTEPVAVWSAGCASGEEAYTLAALADEIGLGDRCRIVASDASRRSLDKAQRAAYGAWSMRSTTAAELRSHFQEQDGAFHVKEHLRRRTRFLQRNLLDGPPPPGRFDLVLCRNLLIYLTPAAVDRAAQILTDALTRDGWLLTAAGDPPLGAAGLEPVRTRHGLAYRRAHGAGSTLPPVTATAAPAATTAAPAATTAATARRVAAPHARRSHAVPRAPRPAAVRAAAATPAAQEPADAETLAARVRALGDAGRLDEACRAVVPAVQAHPLDVQLRYLAGVVLAEAGRLEEAAAAAAQAVYLGPDLPAAHLLLGQVEHARGNTDRARRSFRNGSRLLAAAPGDAPIALAGDVPALHLAAVAERYLATHRGGS